MAKILLVEARFYAHLNDMLLAGARAAVEQAGHEHETVTVPGALEIPGAIALADDSGLYDAYVALGVIIRGETYHFEVVSNESARGIMALVRSDPAQLDKGGGAAEAALSLLALQQRFGA
jgi:6,7-dimethyl-8-ribityllumazine synthase